MKNETIIGLFSDRDSADNTITDLKNLGYSTNDISILVKNDETQTEVTHDTSSSVAEGAATGATTGGALGALGGLLVGLGAITIPGIGALFIGGPIAAALGLTGAAATAVSAATSGVLAGGLVGALVGMGLPEEVASIYETRIKEGGVVLAVPIMNNIDRDQVISIYNKHGADRLTTVNGK